MKIIRLSDVFQVSNERLGEYVEEPPVFAISKYDGVVLGSDYHDRRVASDKLNTYKVLGSADWAYSTIHIDEGSIARNNHGFLGVVSPMYTILRWTSNDHDPRYFEYLLRSPEMLAIYGDMAQGSINRRRSLPWKSFSSISVSVPSIEEQRRIVDLVGAVDDAIAAASANRSALGALNTQSLASIYSSLQGTSVTLTSVFSHIIGGSWGSEPGAEDTDVLAIGPSAYANGRTEVDAAVGTPRSLSSKRAGARTIQAGDVVLERSGGSATQPVGRVLRARETPPSVVPSDFMRLLRPDSTKVDPPFAYWVMWLLYKQDAALPFQKFTTGIRNLNIPDYLGQTSIILPSDRDEQAGFCATAEAFLAVTEEQSAHIKSLRALRSELLASLLSGAHRIPGTYDELMGA